MSKSLFDRSDLILKIEHTQHLIKQTNLVQTGFEILEPSTVCTNLLNIMEEHGDYSKNSLTGEPIFNSLWIIGDMQTVKQKVAVLLGKYAESLFVINCNSNASFNRHFARLARFGKKSKNDFLNNFTAISTGSQKTKESYQMHYNYTESQRDIVWVDNRDILSLLTIPNKSGAVAGLQLKVSYDWKNLKPKLKQYYYPILYFSMSDDWDYLNDYIETKKEEGGEFDHVHLVPMDEYSKEILEILYGFEKILVNLIEGKITLKYLIDKSIEEENSNLVHTLTKSSGAFEICLVPNEAVKKAREIQKSVENMKSECNKFGL